MLKLHLATKQGDYEGNKREQKNIQLDIPLRLRLCENIGKNVCRRIICQTLSTFRFKETLLSS